MRYTMAFCLAAFLCLAGTAAHSQSPDTLAGDLDKSSAKFFRKVQSQSADLNQEITHRTTNFLTRMSRWEEKLRLRLAATDPNSAASLFGGSQQQYATLATRLQSDTVGRPVALSGQYLPYADTLQAAMNFLHLQAASGQFQLMQAKLQDADIAKAYVQSRQEQISGYLAQHSNLIKTLGSPLAGMQRETYYYSQRVAQYKALLADPGALAQKTLSMLGQLPAFQSYMRTHSQLGSLFHVPGNYSQATSVGGLQTKLQVAGIVQSNLSSGGPAGAAALQTNLQSAQSQLDGYKDKLNKLGIGNGDAQMPNFQPNDQKTKTFLKRLQFGFDLQATHYSNIYPSLLSLGLNLGYKLGHSNVIGVGMAYQLGTGNGIRDVHLTSQGLGLRSFVNIKLKGSFSATGGFEYNYVTPFASYQQLRQIQDWQRSGLIGLTKTISTKSKLLKQSTLSLLWDFLSYSQVPRTQPLLFRIGYNF
jgi:hypothetical protein